MLVPARSISTVRPVRPIYTVRPVSTARQLASKIAQSNSVIRPNHPRLDIVRPKASNSSIKRSYFTQPVYRPKDLKPDVKTFRVKNMTTVRTRAIVSKGKVENVLKKAKWVWRPKMNYQDHVYKYNGSYMLKKFEYGNPEILLQDHAVVDSGCSSHMTGNKAYLSNYEDFNGGFMAFGSDPKGGDIVPLLPAMLAGAVVDQGEGSAQPAEPHHTPVDPISSTSQPPIPSPPHPSPPPHSPFQSPPHSPPHSPPYSPHQSPPFSPPHFSPPRINSLEKELKDTKQTLGNAVVKLVKKVKSLETALKRKSKKVLISESEGEESEDQGREIQDIDDDPIGRLKNKKSVLQSWRQLKLCQVCLLSSVSKAKSTDKGKRYRRRARSMAKKIDTGLDAEEEINTGIEEVSTGSTKVDFGTASKRGQREGKAPIVEEDIQATRKTKEQMRQEEAG
ncbi:hypothetical protein Tco_0706886 [Tanacetum coccineum]|uniref:Uncharacterized protein n=1 Tax=Tanacetum coccineum TaxID=301880 RepID=A0ABQ4Y9H9_9ASTR